MIFHAVLCSIQWLKFLAWEEFDEEIWGEGLRPAYIENSIIFTPQFLKTLNLELVIKHLVQGSWLILLAFFLFVHLFVFAILFLFINTYLIMGLLVFPPMLVFVFPHSKMGMEAWYRVSTVELEVKARFQPFPFLLLWTDGNFFPHSFTNLYEKSGHLHNDNFDREIQGVPKKITFLKFILGPVGPLTGITLHHFGTT